MCFGHHTLCCSIDMDKEPAWHEVTFKFQPSSYKIKQTFPKDLEDSILEYCNATEHWNCGEEFEDGFVIGVTKWKKLEQTT